MEKIDESKLESLGFRNVTKEDKKIFLALSANYGNIGDIAISIAQELMIKNIFPDRKIVEIPMSNALHYEDEIKKIMNDNDILTLIGGGNMGNIYLGYEQRRRFIIKLFKNNKTISFPQSIDFTDDEAGKTEFQNSINDYFQNKNLTIFAREQKSFDIMKANFKNEVKLVPDIVFSLKDKLPKPQNSTRQNITLCLRNDKEKITSSNLQTSLACLLENNGFKNIFITDTYIGEVKVEKKERMTVFEKCIKEFQNSKVVVTDRLHGMIFSVITNTPCIALDNSNHKISSTYNTWLKNIPTVKFMEEYDENKILDYITDFCSNAYIANFDFQKDFKALTQALKS
jgi:pyruvyl transferase EpsI